VRALCVRARRHGRIGANAIAESRRDLVDLRELIREPLAIVRTIQIQRSPNFTRQRTVSQLRVPHRRRDDADDDEHEHEQQTSHDVAFAIVTPT
jgi:hypothetical protein